jgi:hypothetical protein
LQAVADFDSRQKKKIATAFNLPLAKLSDEPADLADEAPKEPPKLTGKRILPSWISGSAAKSAKSPGNGAKQKGKKRAADEGLEKAEKKARRGEEDRAEEGGLEEEGNAEKREGGKGEGKGKGKGSGTKAVARKKREEEDSASGEESEEVRGGKRGGKGAARRKKGEQESDSAEDSEGVQRRGGKRGGKAAARKQRGDEESDSPRESNKRGKARSRKAPPTRTGKPPAARDLSDGEVESGPESEPDNETEPGQPGGTALLGGKSVPFEKLLDGVTFAISGIQNPERARLRGQAEEMGAEYRFDWGDDCTLLVCAVKGTPKFKQVNTVNLFSVFIAFCLLGSRTPESGAPVCKARQKN